jgi:F0F1-type ATP synthase assembly protein I
MIKKMRSGKSSLPLIFGSIVVAGAAAILFFFPGFGPKHLVTGTVFGIGIAYLGFLLYYFLMPRPWVQGGSFFSSYLPGAAARYSVMIGVFCAAVFLLNIHPLGVLLGTFIGMMLSTFLSLNSMRQKPQKPPEA